ncbi:DUF2892 domain-containing protein [Candidatus Saccharibacteria bacterium]|nr:DUF2892 domain-containing protein [Candidatus Saccharibacteria bacterium]
MGFINYMATEQGRSLRTTVGAVLVMLAVAGLHGSAGVLVVPIGVVFMLVGVFDVCLLAPLFGKPLRGKDLRK